VFEDAVKQQFGNSVANILASPNKVRAYILSMDKPTEKSQTIGGFTVSKKLGNVPVANFSVLQFLIQDANNYQADSLGVRKCYFEPYLAFEFIKGKEKAFVMLAFNCECWGVVFGDLTITKPYLCHKQLLRLSYALLPNDRYINKLLTYQEEEK
jgi:hypothetical protein